MTRIWQLSLITNWVPWKNKNPLLTYKLAKSMFKIALKACKLRADIINAAS